jgi:hypothetical protein
VGTILGVSHLVKGVSELDTSVSQFTDLGYSLEFREPFAPVVEQKQPFVRVPQRSQQLAFLKHRSNVSVELLLYDGPSGRENSTFDPIFAKGAGSDADENPVQSALQKVSFRSSISAMTIAVRSTSFQESLKFWQALRFSTVQTDWGAELTFRSPVPTWSVSLCLQDDPQHDPSFLDDHGWSCLSLHARGSDEILRNVRKECRITQSEPFRFHAGGRELKITFVRSPGGELVELLEIQ